MRHSIVVFFVLFATLQVEAQDLIVTVDSDSIHATIRSQDSTFVYYSLPGAIGDGQVALQKSKITTIEYDYFFIRGNQPNAEQKVTDPPAYIPESAPAPATKLPDKPQMGYGLAKVHLSLSYNFSYRTAPVSADLDPDLQAFLNELRGGKGVQFRAHVFINEDIAIGFLYNEFRTSHSAFGSVIVDEATQEERFGTISTDIAIKYFAPSLMGRYTFSDLFIMNYTAAIGYMSYQDISRIVIFDYEANAGTIGFSADIGFEYKLAENVGIGLGFSYITGALLSFEETYRGQTRRVSLDQPEGLGRINLFGGFRFYLGCE